MAKIAIRAEDVRKRYTMGRQEPYRALRDVLTDMGAAPYKAVRRLMVRDEDARRHKTTNVLWALDGVSFEIEEGEVVGIIGPNGAGKSTLLKILSRITEPTHGRIELRGRIGSLLEVGTGFHPELTGRENVFLNGSILGMRRTEIERRFDEIVDFSGVEDFLDTPVKRYSSGMAVRLAFAVAAHLHPEILLVDEVLAVGDAQFQEKCIGKMEEVTREGRTILFVSHNMSAVRRLCPRAILLERGRAVFDGETRLALQTYLDAYSHHHGGLITGDELEQRSRTTMLVPGEPPVRCTRIAVVDENASPTDAFVSNEEIAITVDFDVITSIPRMRILVMLADENGIQVLRTETTDNGHLWFDGPIPPGSYRSSAVIPRDLFGDVRLYLSLGIEIPDIQRIAATNVLRFGVAFQGYNGNLAGSAVLRPVPTWRSEVVEPTSSVSLR